VGKGKGGSGRARGASGKAIGEGGGSQEVSVGMGRVFGRGWGGKGEE